MAYTSNQSATKNRVKQTSQNASKKKASRKPSTKTKRPPISRHSAVYFKTFGIYCAKLDLEKNDETRYAITREALGYEKSSKLFTETEWDIVLRFMRHRINGNAGAWTAADRVAVEIDGERARKLFRIRREIPEAYLREIAWDKFKVRDYETLSIPQLELSLIHISEPTRPY